MSEKPEALWVVCRDKSFLSFATPYRVFRTRAAARKFVADKQRRSRVYKYVTYRATWGPEQ